MPQYPLSLPWNYSRVVLKTVSHSETSLSYLWYSQTSLSIGGLVIGSKRLGLSDSHQLILRLEPLSFLSKASSWQPFVQRCSYYNFQSKCISFGSYADWLKQVKFIVGQSRPCLLSHFSCLSMHYELYLHWLAACFDLLAAWYLSF